MSDEELQRLMAEVIDGRGVDRGVEAASSALSPEQRRQTEENLRRFIERMRTAIQQNG
jgi:hypothetical protein